MFQGSENVIYDIHKPSEISKTKSLEVYDLLLEKRLVIGYKWYLEIKLMIKPISNFIW